MIVAGEIIKIHSYLLKAPQLKYVVGASRLLEVFSTKLVPEIAEQVDGLSTVHVAAAGGFTIELSEENSANRFKEAVTQVASQLFGSGLLVVCGPFNKAAASRSDIYKQLGKLKKAASLKSMSASVSFQYMERCPACGEWGVEKIRRDKGGAERLCSLCFLKRQARDKQEIRVELMADIDGITEITIGGAADTKTSLSVAYPEDMSADWEELRKIAEKSEPSGYIGLLYTDGNMMGEIMGACSTIKEYADKSAGLKARNKDAIAKAKASLAPGGGFNGHMLLSGGDDMLAVMPASQALPFTRTFLEHAVENQTPFSHGICAGLIFAKPTIPMNLLFDKAEELLKSAKSQVRKNGGSPLNKTAVDFMFLTSALMAPLDTLPERKPCDWQNGTGKKIMMTARPYLLEEFNQFTRGVSDMKKQEPPRRLFMDLKEIFNSQRAVSDIVPDTGEIPSLATLIQRVEDIYPEIKVWNLLMSNNILNCCEWTWKDRNGRNKEVNRLWQADILEISEFV